MTGCSKLYWIYSWMEFILKCHFSIYYSVRSNSDDKQIPFRECLTSQSPRQYRHKFRPWVISNINIIWLIWKNVVPQFLWLSYKCDWLSIRNKMQLTRSLYDIRFKSYGSISVFHVFGDLDLDLWHIPILQIFL